ncbi:MAG: hypothetical protein ACI4EP_05235 [Suilimivivens sp.]
MHRLAVTKHSEKRDTIPSLCCSWSRISDYQDYLDYEEMLMEVIDEVPLDWEFAKWVESARKQKVEKGR